jgi:hypothetical protein
MFIYIVIPITDELMDGIARQPLTLPKQTNEEQKYEL